MLKSHLLFFVSDANVAIVTRQTSRADDLFDGDRVQRAWPWTESMAGVVLFSVRTET